MINLRHVTLTCADVFWLKKGVGMLPAHDAERAREIEITLDKLKDLEYNAGILGVETQPVEVSIAHEVTTVIRKVHGI